MNILSRILATKREELAQAKAGKSFGQILAEARSVERQTVSFSNAICSSDTGIIAEFKRRSPSKGFINEDADVASVVGGYTDKGAAAISVLTDADYFAGSLDDLRRAREVSGLPILRKDFIIDEYQICEARLAGADVILLIAAALTCERCGELALFARSLGLEVLLEVHDQSELGHISDAVSVVGINNRDLTTFVTDTAVSVTLGRLLPRNIPRISESGISRVHSVRELRAEGFRGFLMGENFMKREDPPAALGEFIKELGNED